MNASYPVQILLCIGHAEFSIHLIAIILTALLKAVTTRLRYLKEMPMATEILAGSITESFIFLIATKMRQLKPPHSYNILTFPFLGYTPTIDIEPKRLRHYYSDAIALPTIFFVPLIKLFFEFFI